MSSSETNEKRDRNLVADPTRTQNDKKSKQDVRIGLIKPLPKISTVNNDTLLDSIGMDDKLKVCKPSSTSQQDRSVSHGTKTRAITTMMQALVNDFETFSKMHFHQSYAPGATFNTDKSSMKNVLITPFPKKVEPPKNLVNAVVEKTGNELAYEDHDCVR